MLTVGHLHYINALPFYAGFLSGAIPYEVCWVSGVPSSLNQLLEKGTLDISLISSYEYLKNQDQYVLLPDHCIAAYDRVLSVSLYIKKTLADLNGRPVGLTAQSTTSSRLVEALSALHWKIHPQFKIMKDDEPLTNYEGFLLIGDRALLNLTIPDYQTIDIATVWHEMTGLPLTFAVFAARRSVWEKQREEVCLFSEKLNASLQWSKRHSENILQLAEKQCPAVSREILQTYFNLLHYAFGPQEKQGLRHYEKLLFPS
jgi:chorismate dehydratase